MTVTLGRADQIKSFTLKNYNCIK